MSLINPCYLPNLFGVVVAMVIQLSGWRWCSCRGGGGSGEVVGVLVAVVQL